MFSAVIRVSAAGIRSLARTRPQCTAPLASRCYSHAKAETDEEFDARWVTYFNKPNLDDWELRKGVNTLIGYDLVPEPKILDSALRACRRLNDMASAVRILEAVKNWKVFFLKNGCVLPQTTQDFTDSIPRRKAEGTPYQVLNINIPRKEKSGPHKEIYPYVIQELRPTLMELGISTPEELGIDKV